MSLTASTERKLQRQKGLINQIVCDVFVRVSLKEEAELFAGQYEGTTKLNPIHSYRANIIRGEEVDTLIKEVCDKY